MADMRRPHGRHLRTVAVAVVISMNYEGWTRGNMTDDQHILKSSGITATIKAFGAELCSLRDAEGKELLWQAGEVWPRHSPLLFPIIGRLKNDQLHHRGKTYPMTQHGVARDHRFE
jgi:galactose mutarotase-like enzyme